MLIIPLNLDSVLLFLHNSKVAYYVDKKQFSQSQNLQEDSLNFACSGMDKQLLNNQDQVIMPS